MAPLARWVRRTRRDWEALVRRQKESGLSQAAYCRREGITLTSFEKWKQRVLSEARFVDVTPHHAANPSGWELEVSLPSGVVLRFRGRPMLLRDEVRRILAYSEAVDMRKSFTGLMAMVQGTLKEDPLDGTMYAFFNRRGNFVKLIYWDRTGFCLFAKRLEHGRFTLPGEGQKQELSTRAFSLLLDGISLGKRRRIA